MYRNYKDDKEKYPNIATYFQLGLIPVGKSGKQLTCDCPFCGGTEKLYVNPDNKMWDCKKCDLNGGFKTFIDEIKKVHTKEMSNRHLLKIANMKTLPVDNIKKYSFGYDSVNQHYTLFISGQKKTEITNVRIIDRNGKFLNVNGFSVTPFGLDSITRTTKHVWLVEGEFDKIALETIFSTKNIDDAVVCIPGAKIFKDEWKKYFQNKEVHVAYDNDDAGFKGCIKVNNALVSVAKKIDFIHWGEDAKDKYDVRDFYSEFKDKPRLIVRKLKKLLQPKPIEVEGAEVESSDSQLDSYDGEFVAPKEIEEVYKKWLHMPNTEMLDVMYGTAIANRLPGQPLWIFIIGASGSGKTELIDSIGLGPNMTSESHVTAKSLISGAHGAGGSDPSLIPKLNGKVLTIKDFTVTINSNPFEVEETFGILRDIYDGKIERTYGNGTERKFKSKFGIIACVTPIIDEFTKENTALGERFLKYRLPTPQDAKSRLEYIKRALENSGSQDQMREELAEIGRRVLSYDYPPIDEIPKKINAKIMALAQFLSMARATVMRDKYQRDRITHKPYQELGTRLSQQFAKQIRGITMYRGKKEPTEKEYDIVKRIGLSSIPDQTEDIISYMCENDAEEIYYLKDLQPILGIAMAEVNYILEDMTAIGILKLEQVDDGGKFKKSAWCLTEDALFLIEIGELYEL